MILISLIKTSLSLAKFVDSSAIMAANVCTGGVSCTLNTRYEDMGQDDIVSLAHYPKTVVLYEYDV